LKRTCRLGRCVRCILVRAFAVASTAFGRLSEQVWFFDAVTANRATSLRWPWSQLPLGQPSSAGSAVLGMSSRHPMTAVCRSRPASLQFERRVDREQYASRRHMELSGGVTDQRRPTVRDKGIFDHACPACLAMDRRAPIAVPGDMSPIPVVMPPSAWKPPATVPRPRRRKR
jgi:hypothetical protein